MLARLKSFFSHLLPVLFSPLYLVPLLSLIFPSSPHSPQVQQIDRVVEVMEETLKGMLNMFLQSNLKY